MNDRPSTNSLHYSRNELGFVFRLQRIRPSFSASYWISVLFNASESSPIFIKVGALVNLMPFCTTGNTLITVNQINGKADS